MTVHPERIKSTDLVESPETARAQSPLFGATLHEWITTVDHKQLGILYILYALVFLVRSDELNSHDRRFDPADHKAGIEVPGTPLAATPRIAASSAIARKTGSLKEIAAPPPPPWPWQPAQFWE